jgi:hypothetical protein
LLVAPLATVPAIAGALMEYGPERSFVFAIYPLVWGLAFLVTGLSIARQRPTTPVSEVLARSAAWSTALVAVAVAVLVVLSFLFAP